MCTIGEENVSPFAKAQSVLDKASERDVSLHRQIPTFKWLQEQAELVFISASGVVLQISAIFKLVFPLCFQPLPSSVPAPLGRVAKSHQFSGFSWPGAGICHCWQYCPVLLIFWVFFLMKYWTKGWICHWRQETWGIPVKDAPYTKHWLTAVTPCSVCSLFSLGWMVNLKFVLVKVYLESGNVDIHFKREADLPVRSVALQSFGLELNFSKTPNFPKQGCPGALLLP